MFSRDYSGPHPPPQVEDSQDDQLGDTGLSRSTPCRDVGWSKACRGRKTGWRERLAVVLQREVGLVFSEHLPGKGGGLDGREAILWELPCCDCSASQSHLSTVGWLACQGEEGGWGWSRAHSFPPSSKEEEGGAPEPL